MSHFPPPGPPPGEQPSPPPGTPAGPPPGWPGQPDQPPPPAYAGPVHQPGVVPLRPLRLGDVFGGALALMRRNPKATVGMAALVNVAFLALPALFSVVMALSGQSADPFGVDGGSAEIGADVSFVVGAASGGLFGWLASIVVTGLMVPVVEHGLVGVRLRGSEAWRRSRRRLLPLLGLSVLSLVVGVLVLGLPIGLGIVVGLAAGSGVVAAVLGFLGGVLGMVALIFLFVRFGLLSPPALVSEGHGVFSSIGRANGLSRGGFWRLLGIYILASIAGSVIGQVFAVPLGLIGGIGGALLPENWSVVTVLLASNLASVLSGAIVTPFTGGVVTLLYFDQRFRHEGLDINLLNEVQSGRRR